MLGYFIPRLESRYEGGIYVNEVKMLFIKINENVSNITHTHTQGVHFI